MRGGCRARAPPDVSQAEMEVTWEGGQGHQESRGALPGARKSRGACDHFLSCFTHPQQPRSARALTLHLPPGLTVCSGRPRSGWGGVSAREAVSRPPGARASLHHFPLGAARCHGSRVTGKCSFLPRFSILL